MEVGELVKQQQGKQQLKQKRTQLIQEQLRKNRREKVNIDQSAVKKGHIEKHKYIAKRTFETIVDKGRKVKVQIQQNATPYSFIRDTTSFITFFNRTKDRIKFDNNLFVQGLTAVNAFGIANKQFSLNFTLEFEKQIVCEPKPFLIQIPRTQPCKEVVIILPQIKQREGFYEFQKITQRNISALTSSQFVAKYNNEAIFSKRISQQIAKCYVQFELFKKNPFYRRLLKKGVPIFPIDARKVPFQMRESIKSFPQLINYLSNRYISVLRSGKQQIFRLKAGEVQGLIQNSKMITHALVAKLIERSKAKGNALVKLSVKTATSINFDLYIGDQS